MNYTNIYNAIITNAMNRNHAGPGERHHIIPKCIGGSNSSENIVKLSSREHFICHLLLCEMYPNNQKLHYAAWAMSNQRSPRHNRNYKVSSRIYERLKERQSQIIIEYNKTRIITDSHREKLRKANTGSTRTDDVKKKMSLTRLNKKRGPYNPKELKFECTCKYCDIEFKAADVKCYTCPDCKKPRPCKCGCGKIIKTPGHWLASGCNMRGKTYLEIYGTDNPKCGFKNKNKI